MVPRFKPLVPAQLTDPSLLRFPMYLSPRIDGVRCALHPLLGPVSGGGARLLNPHVRERLEDPRLRGLDGEIAVGEPNMPEVLVRTLPEVFWSRRPVEFGFHVFDDFTDPLLPFRRRIEFAKARVEVLGLPWLHVLPQQLVKDAQAMFRAYLRFVADGFQGVVLRSPEGHYWEGPVPEASRIAIRINPDETT